MEPEGSLRVHQDLPPVPIPNLMNPVHPHLPYHISP